MCFYQLGLLSIFRCHHVFSALHFWRHFPVLFFFFYCVCFISSRHQLQSVHLQREKAHYCIDWDSLFVFPSRFLNVLWPLHTVTDLYVNFGVSHTCPLRSRHRCLLFCLLVGNGEQLILAFSNTCKMHRCIIVIVFAKIVPIQSNEKCIWVL